MRYILILFIFTIFNNTSVSAEDGNLLCNKKMLETELDILIKNIEKATYYKASTIATEHILEVCKLAAKEKKSSVWIVKNKIRFSQFSYDYDVGDPFFYCKNKLGYESYHSQLKNKVMNSSKQKEYDNRAKSPKTQEPPRKSIPVKKAIERWICPSVFFYIKSNKPVDETAKNNFEAAHKKKCVPVNP